MGGIIIYYLFLGIILLFVFLFVLLIIQVFVIRIPKIIYYIPFAILVSIGIWIIGRFLYLTWSGVYAACNADPSCMNEDWSIVLGILAIFLALPAFFIAKLFSRAKTQQR